MSNLVNILEFAKLAAEAILPLITLILTFPIVLLAYRKQKTAGESAAVDVGELSRKIRNDISEGSEPEYEVDQLVKYYSQILQQSRASFYFSLAFASIGFFIIVTAAFLYSDEDFNSVAVKFSAGLVMEIIAGLFFVQSDKSQKSMADFFEKLRTDKQLSEAKMFCSEIEDSKVRDQLKYILSLHNSGILIEGMIDEIVARGFLNNLQTTSLQGTEENEI